MFARVHLSGPDYMIINDDLEKRIEEAFKAAKTPKRSILKLKVFLCMTIGPRIAKGSPAIFSFSELCSDIRHSEKTVRKWLKELERVGFISKRRGGPGKVEIQLHPNFMHTGPLPEGLEEYLEEYLEEQEQSPA